MFRAGAIPVMPIEPLGAPFTLPPPPDRVAASVAVVGLGYVGLPTALAFHATGARVVGVDVDDGRRARIARGEVDLLEQDRARLLGALDDPCFQVVASLDDAAPTDAVVVCVPTPVDRHQVPDTTAIDRACDAVARRARPGQLLVLTSTSYVGTTRRLLVEPLVARGLHPGADVRVAFCPERIDPGRPDHHPGATPRVVGGASPRCAEAAAELLAEVSPAVHVVSSLEAAEMSKLVENTFRAVNIALANEYADVAGALGLDVMEVISAAATKPYGFMPFRPGPGVGGHCIPCDPHYLLWQLRGDRLSAPVIEHAMTAIAARPVRVAEQALAALARAGVARREARVVLVGLSYKPGVEDVRESPALAIAALLRREGVEVRAWDPHVRTEVRDEDGVTVPNGPPLDPVDLAVVLTVHGDVDHGWLDEVPVLDATYQLPRPASGGVGSPPPGAGQGEVAGDERTPDPVTLPEPAPLVC